ncbi:YhcH/YjgK/YiaL family protein [Chitinophaga vietnamensis]|uniref:YhcH/YjgK/YiaL family protein n=1 Tax=Chitinophaga vietnamensis TaxID=2593957 RepID=UPI00117894B3|nr:YhcH/YjgK/YiaL family protein [Chitinophaga vietnamensis]
MIIDTLQQASLYHGLGQRFITAFDYLARTDFTRLEKGKYEIDGSHIFAIVNEYDTVDASSEQMEAHKKYIDVQYIVQGEEMIGHNFMNGQQPSQAYSDSEDYMLFAEKPSFFTKLQQGHFAIFFPTDLHMPNLQVSAPAPVKKVVIKISVS